MKAPYYSEAGIQIYHGDCREILPELSAGVIDLVLTDPPYGIRHSSNHGASWERTTIQGDADTSVRDVFLAGWGGPAFVFGTWKVERPNNTRHILIWDKGPAFGMGDLAFPWKCSFEEIYVIGNGFVGRRDESVLRGHIVVSWESGGRTHPHEKPVSLCAYLISKTTATTILDPFCGTGPTLRAAKDLGRHAIGIEIEERYCEMAANRLRQSVMDFGK